MAMLCSFLSTVYREVIKTPTSVTSLQFYSEKIQSNKLKCFFFLSNFMLFSRNTEKINPIGLVHGITELNLELKHSLFDKKMLT